MGYSNENRKKRIRTIVSVLKLLILFAIVIGLPIYVYFTYPELIDRFKSLDEINKMLRQYETASIFIYIGLQIIQIIISVLPGQALQFAAGYAYPFWLGFLIFHYWRCIRHSDYILFSQTSWERVHFILFSGKNDFQDSSIR